MKYDVVHFNEVILLRIKKDDVKLMHKIIKKSKGIYDNQSHFIRCAIIRLIRDEKKRVKL